MTDEHTIDEILATWRDRVEAGESVDLEAFVRAHPRHEEELRAQFAAVQILDLAVLETIDAAAEDHALPDRERIGHYRLLRSIGKGGMGRVYLAEQEKPVQRQVALKVLAAELRDTKARARFEVEREALAKMDHPYVAPVYDAGIAEDGTPYVAMAYVDGLPVTEYCDRRGLVLKERLELFAKVCEGVQHAHQKGILHRDIKPGNVLVTEVDGQAVPRVIDFGLAKAYGDTEEDLADLTMGGQVLGTPAYMSPEQAAGKSSVDVRTDVYSLGILLFELLTGNVPWGRSTASGSNLVQVLRRILEEEPPAPSSRVSVTRQGEGATSSPRSIRDRDLKGDLDWIVVKSLAKEPSHRYASASELADDVRRYLRNEAVLAGPPTTSYRIRKFLARHRSTATAAVLTFAGLLAALVVSLHNVQQARLAEEQSTQARGEAEDLLVFMMDDLASGLSDLNRLDLLGEIDERAIRYFDAHAATSADRATTKRRAHALQRIGRTRIQQGKTDRAVELAQQVIQIAADDPALKLQRSDAHLLLGLAAQVRGDMQEAESAFRERLELLRGQWPEQDVPLIALRQFESLRALGDLLQRSGRNAEAIEIYERARELASGRAAGATDDETWRGREGAALHALGHSRLHLRLVHEAQADLEAAIEALGEAYERRPKSVRWRSELAGSWDSLGLLLTATGKLERGLELTELASSMFDELAAEDPTNTKMVENRVAARVRAAGALQSLGRFDEGQERLEAAVRLADELVSRDPTNTSWREAQCQAVFRLGVLHSAANHKDDEFRVFRRAADLAKALAALDPGNSHWQSLLSSAQQVLVDPLLVRGETNKALEAGRRAVDAARRASQAAPNDAFLSFRIAMTLSSLGLAYAGTGRMEEALRAYGEAEDGMSLLPEALAAMPATKHDHALMRLQHGGCLLNAGQVEEALSRLRASADYWEQEFARLPADATRDALRRARHAIALAETGVLLKQSAVPPTEIGPSKPATVARAQVLEIARQMREDLGAADEKAATKVVLSVASALGLDVE